MRRMKRTVRIVSLVLVLAMMLTLGTVFAAAKESTVPVVYGVKINAGYSLKLVGNGTTEVTSSSGQLGGKDREAFFNVEKLTLILSGTKGAQYMVFLVQGTDTADKVYPGANNIYFIDQFESKGVDSITIYPKDLKDPGHYRIYVSSSAGYVEVGELNVANEWYDNEYMLGDLDDDGDVDLDDALEALKVYVKKVTETDQLKERGDINRTNKIDLDDALSILKKYVGKTISIEEG